MICTSVFYNQFQYIDEKDLGFDPELLFAARMSYGNTDYSSVKEELLQNPNVINVTATDVPVLFRSRGYTYNVEWQKKDPLSEIEFETKVVDLDYLKTFNMEIIKGRTFSNLYSTDTTHSFILNESAARIISNDDPLNNIIKVNGIDGKIIGIVKNFHTESFYDEIKPVILIYQPKKCKWVCVKVNNHNLQSTMEFIGSKWDRLDPGYEFEYYFLDNRIERLYRTDARMGRLFTYFTILAIIISCLGMIGLSGFLAEQKTKEIGIRKVLGASVRSIVTGFSKEFAKWVFVANLFAWPLAYYFMSDWLNNFAYRVELSIWEFLLSGVLALLVAFLTISYQAVKAAYANPVKSLRND